MSSAYEIVMESRRELVDKIIAMMEQGRVFTAPVWNRAALRPMNPLSGVKYKGANKLRLMSAVIEREYKDPRWMTAVQLKKAGYYVKKGEHGILCEKWIFTKEEKRKNEKGETEKVIIELKKPVVAYFNVFNAEQVDGYPSYVPCEPKESEVLGIVEDFMSVSECRISELAQSDAFYSPKQDKICLPLRQFFKDDISFMKTVLHEMAHSTGHKTRLNRPMCTYFGTPEYAKEELRAELGALFIETDLGIHLEGEHLQDHSNYLASWIKALKEDSNNLFRACADAEKISERLIVNYGKSFELNDPETVENEKNLAALETVKKRNRQLKRKM